MPRAKKWKIEIDFGNCERYICPYCNEENDWQSPHCPMCGRKLISSEEIEEAKGLELRKDIPKYLCIRDDCEFNDYGREFSVTCFRDESPYLDYMYNQNSNNYRHFTQNRLYYLYETEIYTRKNLYP